MSTTVTFIRISLRTIRMLLVLASGAIAPAQENQTQGPGQQQGDGAVIRFIRELDAAPEFAGRAAWSAGPGGV